MFLIFCILVGVLVWCSVVLSVVDCVVLLLCVICRIRKLGVLGWVVCVVGDNVFCCVGVVLNVWR